MNSRDDEHAREVSEMREMRARDEYQKRAKVSDAKYTATPNREPLVGIGIKGLFMTSDTKTNARDDENEREVWERSVRDEGQGGNKI